MTSRCRPTAYVCSAKQNCMHRIRTFIQKYTLHSRVPVVRNKYQAHDLLPDTTRTSLVRIFHAPSLDVNVAKVFEFSTSNSVRFHQQGHI